MTKKQTGDSNMAVVALTPDKIHHEISRQLSRGVPYIEALVDFAEKNNYEIDDLCNDK